MRLMKRDVMRTGTCRRAQNVYTRRLASNTVCHTKTHKSSSDYHLPIVHMGVRLRPHNACSVKGSKCINRSAVERNVIDCHVRSNNLGHQVFKTPFTVCVSTSDESIDVKAAPMPHQNTYKLVMSHLPQYLNTSDQCISVMVKFFIWCSRQDKT